MHSLDDSFISGAPDVRWDDDILHELTNIKGSDFEAVNVSSLMVGWDSGQVAGIVPEVECPWLMIMVCGSVTVFVLVDGTMSDAKSRKNRWIQYHRINAGTGAT